MFKLVLILVLLQHKIFKLVCYINNVVIVSSSNNLKIERRQYQMTCLIIYSPGKNYSTYL